MNPFQSRISNRESRIAFTLLELLVVIAVLAALGALALPAMNRGQAAAHRASCISNLRQLAAANTLHAGQWGWYAPAAADILTLNRERWHGQRSGVGSAFTAANGGALTPFLGGDGRVRACPAFRPVAGGFEAGCGGYGYNDRGVGSRSYLLGYTTDGVARGMSPGAIAHPVATVMFADAAFVQGGRLIEYSFAEAYRHLSEGVPPAETYVADPSIHFRHGGRANVVWCDGHVTSEAMTATRQAGGFAKNQLGWFGGPDNALFDPF
jgi:prepilin-type processing-associated H-X9-DG protein